MIKVLPLLIYMLLLQSCHVGYLAKNSWHQQKILRARIPIKKVLKNKELDTETRVKLNLVLDVKRFAETTLGLSKSENYESYVELNRPYVTWVVRAAPPFELKAHTWWFPVVGSVPYKGYFSKAGAKHEAMLLKNKGLDTHVRGVSAYSTLGWFDDPVLSSMLRYEEHDLVNVIIHEMVHATLFIEGHVDFNERLATFIGNIGAESFYKMKPQGKEKLKIIEDENHDQKIFSKFISEQMNSLRAFYEANKNTISKEEKAAQLVDIQNQFKSKIKPMLKTKNYDWLKEVELNNAILLSLETYQSDLSDFEKIYEKLGRDFAELIKYCKSLENADDPLNQLKTDSQSSS